ncbi:MAG: hypothetical protein IPI62_00560 [Bacteroidetes bacterium]|nr:hypothetical protein [Bacteroidota bacterium]
MDNVMLFDRALSASEIMELYGVQNLSYSWSTGATTSSITVNPPQTTIYYVSISNGISSCTDSIKLP